MKNLYRTLKKSIGLLFVMFFNACNFESRQVPPRKHIVEIKQMQFQPALLLIQSGDTVEWINHDFVTHDITEEKHQSWRSSPLVAGASWQTVIKENADYYCSIHQVMKGKLKVE